MPEHGDKKKCGGTITYGKVRDFVKDYYCRKCGRTPKYSGKEKGDKCENWLIYRSGSGGAGKGLMGSGWYAKSVPGEGMKKIESA